MIKFDVFVSLLIVFQYILWMRQEENKWQNILKNWIDIFAIVPIAYIVFIIFQKTNILVTFLFIVRIYALYGFFRKIREIVRFTEKTRLHYATFVLVSTFVFGSLILYLVEFKINPHITSFDDSAYFMIVTMTTVGYGNVVPYTGLGKIISVIAMIVGVGYTGWVTAAIASSLIEQLRKERKKERKEQKDSLNKILEKLDTIEKELEGLKKERKK